MARGWESKSVESQIESAADRKAAAMAMPPTPDEIAHQCERASLELSRIRVMHDLEHATNPRYREQLEAALHYLESKLAALI
ncbi:MAG TPA: hypothetical protein VF023_09010 [Bryobacteraceae bacterium]|jgi:hypothetical protein